MSSNKFVAHVEDADDDGSSSIGGIESTRIYARSEAPSPMKQQPNTGKSRADKQSSRRPDSSDNTSLADSDTTERSPNRDREARRAERDKERRRREKKRDAAEQQARKVRAEAKAAKEREREAKPVKKRPTSLSQSRTDSVVQQYRRPHVEDSAYFGQQQPAASSARPRAQTRPGSFYSNPPPNPMTAYPGWPGQQPQQMLPVGSFPPPMYGGTPPSVVGMPPSAPSHPGYFSNAAIPPGNMHLKSRFDRPASAMGMRPQTQQPYGYPQDQYEPEPEPRLTRRTSRSKKQTDEDRRMMPPPTMMPIRPKSALPPSTPFRPPAQAPSARQPSRPPAPNRRGVGFADQPGAYDDEDYLTAKHEMFADISPEPNHERRSKALARTRRPSVAYEHHGVDIIPAGRRSRASSFYGSQALGTGGVSLEEDKYLTALQYQDNMSGGPSMPLTAESLRKASTRAAGGGSRGSTRSSDSRDESEYQRSKTTGITRSSSSENDNVTIKLSGSAIVRVQGTEIQCDGGEITFSSGGRPLAYGSDRASTVYQIEDGRGRYERKAITHRPRAPSQSDSQSRGYAQSYAPYDPAFVNDY